MSDRQSEPQRTTAPPRYKVALVTWMGAYAVITTILAILGPSMATWPLPLKTLLLSVMMVVAMTWVVIPSLTRLFQGWLSPATAHRREARVRARNLPRRAYISPSSGRGAAW